MLNQLKLFGTRRRTQILILLFLLEETHASELASLLRIPVKTVQRILAGLEDENVISGRIIGRERRIRLNERYFAADELHSLLRTVAARDSQMAEAAANLRRRPRRKGKDI